MVKKKNNGFVKPMLAKSAKNVKKFSDDYLSSPKLDGVRLIVHYDLEDHKLSYFSRNGLEKTNILGSYFNNELEKVFSDLQDSYVNDDKLYPDGLCLDGELVLINDEGKFAPVGDINSLVNRNNELENSLDDSVNLKYYIFDITDKKLTASERYSIYYLGIVETDKVKPVQQEVIEGGLLDSLQIKSNEYRNAGFEGACYRTLDGKYKPGGRGNMLLKLKAEKRNELTAFLTNASLGEGRFSNTFSKFEWSVYDKNLKLVPITHATSGLTDSDIELIDKHIKKGKPKIYSDILFDDFSKNNNGGLSLRFPIISSLRYDLTKDDITIVEQIND